MQFNRMIVTNIERESLEEAARFIYNVTAEDTDTPPSQFCVAEIQLLDNGWVHVTRHDTGVECFPPSRVVTLEILPSIYAVPDRPAHG